MKTILVTGAAGFIGQAVCRALMKNNKVIAFDRNAVSKSEDNYIPVKGDIEDDAIIESVCLAHLPDVVVHCAGIAHQKILSPIGNTVYENINSTATKKIAKIASKANPNLQFIFLSSVSVYGEKPNGYCLKETSVCCPTSDYAVSKLNAETALKNIYEKNTISQIDILRLAPVYDLFWSLNLDKRVFGPQKKFYLKIGSGEQRMSILSRQNLVDFIQYRIDKDNGPGFNIFNICDEKACSFNEMIHAFQNCSVQPNAFVVKIPLFFVRGLSTAAAAVVPRKASWIRANYNKLACSMIFDNQKMLATGFCPKQSLASVFEKK